MRDVQNKFFSAYLNSVKSLHRVYDLELLLGGEGQGWVVFRGVFCLWFFFSLPVFTYWSMSCVPRQPHAGLTNSTTGFVAVHYNKGQNLLNKCKMYYLS